MYLYQRLEWSIYYYIIILNKTIVDARLRNVKKYFYHLIANKKWKSAGKYPPEFTLQLK